MRGYKSVFFFRAARAYADIFFNNVCTIKLLEDACKVKCLNLQETPETSIDFRYPFIDVSKGSTPLYQAVDAIAAIARYALLCKKQDGQIEENI